ncbi:hypothetical protein B0H14DRAFT_2609237 [Mycena olivaceomarginata]|nr:hypothetical protein B0H14DRAFT_2609237 [Mycena olivaceomarginata]
MQYLPLTITAEREFEEAIEGSGGAEYPSPASASTHIKCAVQSTIISVGVFSMRGVISLTQARCDVDASFRQILIDQGIVTALTTAACRLKLAPRSPHTIIYSLVLGDSILPQNSVRAQYSHRSVPCRASIDELETPLDANTFQGFPVSEKWEAFWSLLQERWALNERVYGTRQGVRHVSLRQYGVLCDWGKIRVPALLRLPGIQVKDTIGARVATVRRAAGSLRFDYCTPYTGCEASVETVHEFALDNDIWRHQNARARASGRAGADSCDAGGGRRVRLGRGVEILATEATVADEEAQEQADRGAHKTSSGAG